MLFLNNLWPIEMSHFVADVDYSFATGARVSVHARDTLAEMNRGVTLSPGVETTLSVNQVRRIRLSKPWAFCTDRKYLQEEDEETRYTVNSCLSLCAQHQVGKNPKRVIFFNEMLACLHGHYKTFLNIFLH